MGQFLDKNQDLDDELILILKLQIAVFGCWPRISKRVAWTTCLARVPLTLALPNIRFLAHFSSGFIKN